MDGCHWRRVGWGDLQGGGIKIHVNFMRMNRGRIQKGFVTEGTIELRFDSVWMGVTGGAMVGATSRGVG